MLFDFTRYLQHFRDVVVQYQPLLLRGGRGGDILFKITSVLLGIYSTFVML